MAILMPEGEAVFFIRKHPPFTEEVPAFYFAYSEKIRIFFIMYSYY